MQKARKAIYLMLREHGLDSRRAGHKARLICTERLSKQIGELFHHSTLLGRARFLGLQMEESLAKARNNRREALRFARYAHDGLTPHPRQFPQLREGVDGREVAAGFGDLARNYGAWARVHLMFAHRCSRNLNDLKSRNGLRVIP